MKWFKHDTDANRDPKLEKVLMRYGAEGYALYWLCLELIAAPIDKHNLTFELEHDAEILAHRLKMDSARVEEIMRFMVGLDLFEIDASTTRITCLKLAARLENAIVKNPNLKEIQNLISSEKIPDNPGQSRITSDNRGKVRPDIDIDTDIEKEEEKKNIGGASRPQKRRRQLPDDFVLTEERSAVLFSEIPSADPESVFAHFSDHHRSKGTVMLDWDAAWRTWCRNAKKFSRGPNVKPTESPLDRIQRAYHEERG